MKKVLLSILFKVIRIEHFIYCTTNCTIELPIHKSYYKHRRIKYEKYIKDVAIPKYDW